MRGPSSTRLRLMAHPQDRVVAKLQALVRIPTVSDRDPALVDTAIFDHLLSELADQFPLLHMELELTRVGTHGLLLHWPGASAARPVVGCWSRSAMRCGSPSTTRPPRH